MLLWLETLENVKLGPESGKRIKPLSDCDYLFSQASYVRAPAGGEHSRDFLACCGPWGHVWGLFRGGQRAVPGGPRPPAAQSAPVHASRSHQHVPTRCSAPRCPLPLLFPG